MTDQVEHRDNQRQTLGLFEREDRRHSPRWELRDWIILAVLVGLSLGWYLPVYFFEPGIR